MASVECPSILDGHVTEERIDQRDREIVRRRMGRFRGRLGGGRSASHRFAWQTGWRKRPTALAGSGWHRTDSREKKTIDEREISKPWRNGDAGKRMTLGGISPGK